MAYQERSADSTKPTATSPPEQQQWLKEVCAAAAGAEPKLITDPIDEAAAIIAAINSIVKIRGN